MNITPAIAIEIGQWCRNSDAAVEVPVVVLQQILRELKVAEVLCDKQNTHLNYYYHQDKETRKSMLESAPSIKQQQQEAKELSSKIRDMLVQEFVKSK